MSTAGFVLTGGGSTRMGRDKALLAVEGQTLCEHIADTVASITGEVVLIGHPERYAHLKYACVADLHPDQGPLSGVETALCLERAEFNVICSCDAVNVRAQWLEFLLERAKEGSRCVVARDLAGSLQPLCAVYRSDCRLIVSAALSEGRLRMMDLLQELGAVALKVDDVILNLNTPEGYADRRL